MHKLGLLLTLLSTNLKYCRKKCFVLTACANKCLSFLRISRTVLTSCMGCGWNTLWKAVTQPVHTHTHTYTLRLCYPGNTGVYGGICFAFLAMQYQDSRNLYQHLVHAKWPLHDPISPPSCFLLQCINSMIMRIRHILQKSQVTRKIVFSWTFLWFNRFKIKFCEDFFPIPFFHYQENIFSQVPFSRCRWFDKSVSL